MPSINCLPATPQEVKITDDDKIEKTSLEANPKILISATEALAVNIVRQAITSGVRLTSMVVICGTECEPGKIHLVATADGIRCDA